MIILVMCTSFSVELINNVLIYYDYYLPVIPMQHDRRIKSIIAINCCANSIGVYMSNQTPVKEHLFSANSYRFI